MRRLVALADAIDALNAAIGRGAAWLLPAMAGAVVALVVLRHAFGLGALWLQDATLYAHALLFLALAGWTLQLNGHIRVDIFYAEASPRIKAAIDLFGAMLLLLPFLAVLAWLSLPYVGRSWRILEGSREAGGLPAVFLLKSAIPAFCVLLGLQGLAQALRAGVTLARPGAAEERA